MPITTPQETVLAAPEWAGALVPWLLALLVVAASVAALGVWMLLARLREIERLAERFKALDDIRASLAEFAKQREDLDLRRIEHVLIEMREGQRRLEDALVRSAQHAARPAGSAPSADDPAGLTERVIQRVLVHGYEQVHVVPSLAELAQSFGAGGVHEVLVEARRGGVACKGRVLVRDGVVTDVELKPAYTMFP